MATCRKRVFFFVTDKRDVCVEVEHNGENVPVMGIPFLHKAEIPYSGGPCELKVTLKLGDESRVFEMSSEAKDGKMKIPLATTPSLFVSLNSDRISEVTPRQIDFYRKIQKMHTHRRREARLQKEVEKLKEFTEQARRESQLEHVTVMQRVARITQDMQQLGIANETIERLDKIMSQEGKAEEVTQELERIEESVLQQGTAKDIKEGLEGIKKVMQQLQSTKETKEGLERIEKIMQQVNVILELKMIKEIIQQLKRMNKVMWQVGMIEESVLQHGTVKEIKEGLERIRDHMKQRKDVVEFKQAGEVEVKMLFAFMNSNCTMRNLSRVLGMYFARKRCEQSLINLMYLLRQNGMRRTVNDLIEFCFDFMKIVVAWNVEKHSKPLIWAAVTVVLDELRDTGLFGCYSAIAFYALNQLQMDNEKVPCLPLVLNVDQNCAGLLSPFNYLFIEHVAQILGPCAVLYSYNRVCHRKLRLLWDQIRRTMDPMDRAGVKGFEWKDAIGWVMIRMEKTEEQRETEETKQQLEYIKAWWQTAVKMECRSLSALIEMANTISGGHTKEAIHQGKQNQELPIVCQQLMSPFLDFAFWIGLTQEQFEKTPFTKHDNVSKADWKVLKEFIRNRWLKKDPENPKPS